MGLFCQINQIKYSVFKSIISIFIFTILFYTRFIGLNWGLPYPMHPDERNMAVSVQQLTCKGLETRDQRLVLPAGSQNQQPKTDNKPLTSSLQSLSSCLNPHFFAYGQLPIYTAYFGIKFVHLILVIQRSITYVEATIALRLVSALASVIHVFVLIRLVKFSITSFQFANRSRSRKFNTWKLIDNWVLKIGSFLLFIFSPYFIQFSHFGTTESLLMLFYTFIVYECMKISALPKLGIKNVLLLAFVSGLAIATKISSVIFLGLPIIIIAIKAIYFFAHGLGAPPQLRLSASRGKAGIKSLTESVVLITIVLFITFVITILFSPHYIISFKDFLSSLLYESSVASGSLPVFYTRQFTYSIPVLFQLTKIFPYALGWPQYILALLGFFLLPWKVSAMIKRQVATTQGIPTARRLAGLLGGRALTGNELLTESALLFNLLRFAFLLYFIPTSFLFTKWTRFMAPVLPIMSIFAVLFLYQLVAGIQNKFSIFNYQLSIKSQWKKLEFIENCILIIGSLIIIAASILPGLAYLSIYKKPDVRFKASEWIYQNIRSNSNIVSETANVVDIPMPFPGRTGEFTSPSYQYTSFNFYDLDMNPLLRLELNAVLGKSDYIIVPSRRVFANHTCINPGQNSISAFAYDTDRCEKLTTKYQLLSSYYDSLFSGVMGYELIQEFSSYPKLSLFGQPIVEFPDEQAEETWTVFDHPVIRIYKKKTNDKLQMTNESQKIKLESYKTTNYQLLSTNYRLLVADTPEKWQRGLMFVRSKKDIDGLDGMIFVFTDSTSQRFWNKNTFADLDLYWIQDGEILGQTLLPSIEKSGKTITVSSPAPVNTVIELLRQ